jgi:hypothetical protein
MDVRYLWVRLGSLNGSIGLALAEPTTGLGLEVMGGRGCLKVGGGASLAVLWNLAESTILKALPGTGEMPSLSEVMSFGVPGTDNMARPFPISIGNDDAAPPPVSGVMFVASTFFASVDCTPGVIAGEGLGVGTEAVELDDSSPGGLLPIEG